MCYTSYSSERRAWSAFTLKMGLSTWKPVFVRDDHICFYWDGLFTCSSHLHWPHSVSRDIQIVLKSIYVLTSAQRWRQSVVHFIKTHFKTFIWGEKTSTMQSDKVGRKTVQHAVILLKKHICYQKQFMHTNLFLVHKRFTSAFRLILKKQNCLQREDKHKALL